MSTSTTPPTEAEGSPEMAAIGYVLAAGTFLLLLPILPVIVGLWVVYRVIDRLRP